MHRPINPAPAVRLDGLASLAKKRDHITTTVITASFDRENRIGENNCKKWVVVLTMVTTYVYSCIYSLYDYIKPSKRYVGYIHKEL